MRRRSGLLATDRLGLASSRSPPRPAAAAIQNAAAAVAIQVKGGIVIATEKRVASKLLAPPKSSEKIYTIDDHVRLTRGEGGGKGSFHASPLPHRSSVPSRA